MEVLTKHKDFTMAGLFILDLALVSNKQSYIENIIELPQEMQQILLPFVQEVTQRDRFILQR